MTQVNTVSHPLLRVVLVVSDPKLTAMLQRGLRHEGCLVVGAGEEWEAVCAAFRPHLVVWDVANDNGGEATPVYRILPPERRPAVLVLNAAKPKQGWNRDDRTEYMEKPFALEEFLTKVRAVGAGKRDAAPSLHGPGAGLTAAAGQKAGAWGEGKKP